MPKTIVLASHNSGKLQELQSLCRDHTIQFRLQSDFQITPPETGLSFIENAILKARFAAKITQLPTLADDSGLVVPALQGAPGIYSARYAGENATDADNNAKLLDTLKNNSQREAYFVCVLAYLTCATDPLPQIFYGRLFGQIALTPAGQHGFGYDPIFWLPDQKATLAQLSHMQKNQISHRSIAFKAFCTALSL